MIAHDGFEWTNAVIGGVGLLITGIAAWQATRAKTAATNAEDSVRKHNAEVDFSTLTRLARELHGYVETEDFAIARLRVTDLRMDLATAITTHRKFLLPDRIKLIDQQMALRLIANRLNESSGQISATERIRLLEISGDILDVLASQSGKLRSDIGQGDSHE